MADLLTPQRRILFRRRIGVEGGGILSTGLDSFNHAQTQVLQVAQLAGLPYVWTPALSYLSATLPYLSRRESLYSDTAFRSVLITSPFAFRRIPELSRQEHNAV